MLVLIITVDGKYLFNQTSKIMCTRNKCNNIIILKLASTYTTFVRFIAVVLNFEIIFIDTN